MKRFVMVLAAVAALLLTPVSPARADTAPPAYQLDFWTWQGGYTVNGKLTGQLAFTLPTGMTVTHSWNAHLTTSGSRVTVEADGQFGFGGSLTGAFVLPSDLPPGGVVTVNGRPAPRVIAEPDTLSAPEGSGATFTVRLSAPPPAMVSIAMRMAGTGTWAMPPLLLTFGPADWDRPKSMTMYGLEDPDTIDDVMVVTLSAPGHLPDTVTLTQLDNDRS